MPAKPYIAISIIGYAFYFYKWECRICFLCKEPELSFFYIVISCFAAHRRQEPCPAISVWRVQHYIVPLPHTRFIDELSGIACKHIIPPNMIGGAKPQSVLMITLNRKYRSRQAFPVQI